MSDKFFDRTTGGITLYTTDEHGDGQSVNIRLVAARFGEDPHLVVGAFWHEHPQVDASIAPLIAYGLPPRQDLCSQKSLVAAMQTLEVQPGSLDEQKWKSVCEFHRVAWPKRLSKAA